MKCIQFLVVMIGFEDTNYIVVEEIGSLEVCVRVFEPNDRTELPVERSIRVAVETVAGTAGMCINASWHR